MAYASLTGNVERFVNKLNTRHLIIHKDMVINEPFVLVTYTAGFGLVPQSVSDFLENSHHNLRAVAASGNMNWGNSFAKAADIISSKYNVPVLLKFELAGSNKDIETFQERLREIIG